MQQQNKPRGALYNRPKGAKGLFKKDVGVTEFWKKYYVSKKPIPYSKAQLVLKDLFLGYQEILKKGDYYYIPNMGFFCIAITKREKNKTHHIDWLRTHELWRDQWPNLNAEELSAIKKKPLVHFRNKIGISNNLFINWWKMKPKQKYYLFDPTTTLKKELGRMANHPDTSSNFLEKIAFEISVGQILENSREK